MEICIDKLQLQLIAVKLLVNNLVDNHALIGECGVVALMEGKWISRERKRVKGNWKKKKKKKEKNKRIKKKKKT